MSTIVVIVRGGWQQSAVLQNSEYLSQAVLPPPGLPAGPAGLSALFGKGFVATALDVTFDPRIKTADAGRLEGDGLAMLIQLNDSPADGSMPCVYTEGVIQRIARRPNT